jgi:hypothetical protein
MVHIITLVGLVVCGIAVLLMVRPTAYLGFAERALDSRMMYAGAIIVRIALGAVFMLAATDTRYPGGIFWIGVVFIVAAIAVLFYPQRKMRDLVQFWVHRPVAVRVVSPLMFVFGVYLVYASI